MADEWLWANLEAEQRYRDIVEKWFSEYTHRHDPLRYAVRFWSSDPAGLPPKHATRKGFELAGQEEEVAGDKREYERLLTRHRFLLSLLGDAPISQHLGRYFSLAHTRTNWRLKFEQVDQATAGDYATLFRSLDNLNKLFLSVTKQEYFSMRWLQGERIVFDKGDSLVIKRIVKKSPGEIQGSAVGEVAKALGQVLSVGNQIKDYKLAGVRVKEAEIDLEKKRMDLEEEKRQAVLRSESTDLDAQLARERKLLELEQLRNQRDEAIRNRRRLALEDLNQRFDILTKGLKILSAVPNEMQDEFKAAILNELEEVRSTPLIVSDVQVLEPSTENESDLHIDSSSAHEGKGG